MGTTYHVLIDALPPTADVAALEAAVKAVLDGVDRRMSTHRADSELSRFNDAGAGWLSVSADTLAVVEAAQWVNRLSTGAFDPTIGPLVDLWGFGPAHREPGMPAGSRIRKAMPRNGLADVRVGSSPPALGKDRPELRLDLSGIAKGFAVDAIAARLRDRGIGNFLVEVGGELRGGGYSPRGDAWRIGIERPPGSWGLPQRLVGLGDGALATSGDYRIFFEHSGRRYSHIIDPTTGRPVAHGLASVTVAAPTTMAADALSTALMVLGPEAGAELAAREDIAAYFISRRGEGLHEHASPAFASHLIG
jgi:thiamine biosynthesis lipoprotein